MQARIAEYASFELTADLSSLSAEQKQMLGLLIEAAKIMDGLFWRQAYGDDHQTWRAGLTDPDLERFVELNYGPWDRLGGNEPFVPGVGAKPPGAAFYPADMTKEEFDNAELPG